MDARLANTAGNSISYYLGRIAWRLFRTVLMISMTFVVLYPLLYMISMAFRPAADVYNPQIVWIPTRLTLDNIKMAVDGLEYWTLLGRTAFLSLSASVIQVLIGSTVGYGLGRFKFPGRTLMLVVVLLSIIVPQQIIALPTYLNFNNLDFFGIIRAITGKPSPINLLGNPLLFCILAFFGQGIRSGLILLIFRQFYASMPDELESAAMVDGAGFSRTYLQIMMPNARNIFLVAFLFSLVWYWNDYFLTSIYIGDMPTLAVRLSAIRSTMEKVIGSEAFDSYYMVVIEQSACLLMILPVLLLYIFTQRYFTEGIEKSGIVG